jgi:UrcA family protein
MSTQLKTPRYGSAFLGAAFASLLLATGQAAAAGPNVRSVAVRYGDLDLASDAGVRALYARLRSAAANVCGPGADRDLAMRQAWQACRDEALGRAVSQLGNARLAALHGDRHAGQS